MLSNQQTQGGKLVPSLRPMGRGVTDKYQRCWGERVCTRCNQTLLPQGRAHSFYLFVSFFAGENGIFTLSRSFETMTYVLHFHVDLIVHNAQELPLPLGLSSFTLRPLSADVFRDK